MTTGAGEALQPPGQPETTVPVETTVVPHELQPVATGALQVLQGAGAEQLGAGAAQLLQGAGVAQQRAW